MSHLILLITPCLPAHFWRTKYNVWEQKKNIRLDMFREIRSNDDETENIASLRSFKTFIMGALTQAYHLQLVCPTTSEDVCPKEKDPVKVSKLKKSINAIEEVEQNIYMAENQCTCACKKLVLKKIDFDDGGSNVAFTIGQYRGNVGIKIDIDRVPFDTDEVTEPVPDIDNDYPEHTSEVFKCNPKTQYYPKCGVFQEEIGSKYLGLGGHKSLLVKAADFFIIEAGESTPGNDDTHYDLENKTPEANLIGSPTNTTFFGENDDIAVRVTTWEQQAGTMTFWAGDLHFSESSTKAKDSKDPDDDTVSCVFVFQI